MAKETTGYIGKDKQRKWFARVTLTGTNGTRRNIARRAAGKPIRVIAPKLLNKSPCTFRGTDEVARIAFFLLFEDARYITGQVIQVDSGLAV